MEYTIYNAAMNCPELWKDGVPTLNLYLGISAQNAVQMFWPWQEDQLTQVFCSAPGARFEVEAWDVYHNGKYGLRWKPGTCTTTENTFIQSTISGGHSRSMSPSDWREANSLPLFC